MPDNKYIDLFIVNGDFSLNAGSEPETCNNRISIGQDIIHSIIESGLATLLVGNRNPASCEDIYMQIILLVESDERIIPGTITVNEETGGGLLIMADTYEFGRVTLGVNYE